MPTFRWTLFVFSGLYLRGDSLKCHPEVCNSITRVYYSFFSLCQKIFLSEERVSRENLSGLYFPHLVIIHPF